MTLLDKAFAEVSKLPEEQQEQFAQWILDALEDDARWDRAFQTTQTQLSSLASKALKDHRAGKTRDLEPDDLE